MTTVCDYIEGHRREIVHGLAVPVAAGASACAVWLVSSVTMPLVGGVIGGLSSLVSMVVTRMLESQQVIEDEEADYTFLGLEIGTTIVLSLAAAAMGYAISIPLALLLCATSIIGTCATLKYLS